MNFINDFLKQLSGLLWGVPLVILLLGIGMATKYSEILLAQKYR